MTHFFHNLPTEVGQHTYKGWLATIILGSIGKLMIFVDMPVEIVHYSQFVMYTLASVVSLITIIGWIRKISRKKTEKDTE